MLFTNPTMKPDITISNKENTIISLYESDRVEPDVVEVIKADDTLSHDLEVERGPDETLPEDTLHLQQPFTSNHQLEVESFVVG